MPKIKIQRIDADAVVPSYSHEGDAGLDICSVEDMVIMPFKIRMVKTGIKMEIPDRYVGLVWDKSGLALKNGIKTMAGVIDSGYRGEIMIVLINLSKKKFQVKKGQKIAQMLIQKIECVKIEITDSLRSKTTRSEKGFGSTD